MATESVIFTALPNGVHESGGRLQITVFVSPRLFTDGAGALPLVGSGFQVFEDWPAALTEVGFAAEFDGVGTFPAQPDPALPPPESATWHLLFGKTFVRDGTFPDLSTRRFLSFPVQNAAGYVLDLYTQIAEGFPEEFPPITTGPLAGLGRELGQLSSFKEEFYGGLDGLIAQTGGPPGKSGRFLDRSLIPRGEHRRMTFTEAYRFYDRPDSRDPLGPDRAPDPPPPPDIDFHGAVATCGDYPELLRRLGLALDLVVPFDNAMAPGGRVRMEVESAQPWMGVAEARPWTNYVLDDPRFFAEPRDREADLVDGTLRLENSDAFLVNQIDLDGSTMKTVDFAGNLFRLNEHLGATERSMVDNVSSLPALRTAGFTIARDRRAGRLVAHIDDLVDHEATHAAGGAADLFAEDVTRGYRIDVEDAAKPDRWLSLHRRIGTYRIEPAGTAPVEVPVEPDEGFLKGSSATAVPGNDQDQYLHEALFGWDGWSLAAKRPGLAITNTGAEEIEPENPTAIPLFTSFEAEPGSLPRLRFGRTYRFRARAVDLAGNSVREADLVPTHVSKKHTFRRYDPVPSPAVVPRRPFTEGESLLRMVIRSTLGVLPNAYVSLSRVANLAGHTDPLHAYFDTNERHLAAPITSQQLAEWHGRFDVAIGESSPQPDLDEQFETASRESGSFLEAGPGVFVVNPDPAKVPTDLTDPARSKGDPLQSGEYVCHDVDDLALPYLPDPLSFGVSFTTLPGDAATRLLPWEGGPKWFDRRPVRIRIVDGSGAPIYDAPSRVLTVFLPQAEMVTVRLSSFLDPPDLDLMGMWMRQSPAARAAQQSLAEGGRHWMLTPWQPLTLVHAVEKPLEPPAINVPAAGIPDGGVGRKRGETLAVLAGTISNHAKSTGRLDVDAEWEEPIDDLAREEPSELTGRAHVGDFLLEADEDECRIGRKDVEAAGGSPAVHSLRHEFGDTKHRWVRYRATATTRFREYFPPEITDDSTLVTHAGPEVTLNVPASRQPEPPDVMYVIPTWTWDERELPRLAKLGRRRGGKAPRFHSTLRRTRSGGGLRVYLDRPWYSSGADELLGVVLEKQPWITWPIDVLAGMTAPATAMAEADAVSDQIFTNGLLEATGSGGRSPSERIAAEVTRLRDTGVESAVRRAVAAAGDDFAKAVAAHELTEENEGGASGGGSFSGIQLAAMEHALRAFLLPGGDPQKFVTQWGLDPIWGSAPLHAGPFIHQLPLRVAVGHSVDLTEAPGHQVTVVGHQPEFDPDRKLWFCDLQFDAGPAYLPFVRLALARYQPYAIDGQHLSKVVIPEFAQLVAQRSATISKLGTASAAVTLRGPGAYTDNAMDLAPWFGGLEQFLELSRVAVAQVERLRPGANTDLAWEPVGEEVRLDLSAAAGLGDVRYTGRVKLPRSGKRTRLRLALREYEIFETDSPEADAVFGSEVPWRPERPVKYRLVYADHLPL